MVLCSEINAFGKLVDYTIREGTRTSRQIAANSKRKPWVMSCVKIRSRPDPAAKAYKLSMTKLANLKAAIDLVGAYVLTSCNLSALQRVQEQMPLLDALVG